MCVCVCNIFSQFVDYDQSFVSYKIAIRNQIVSGDVIVMKF